MGVKLKRSYWVRFRCNSTAEHFIEQYFGARDTVNRLKQHFDKRIEVDLLLKDTDNTIRSYKANIDRIDNHIPEKYDRSALEKQFSKSQANPMNLFKPKNPTRHTRFSDFVRNASSAEKKRVYMAVLEKATAEQNVILMKARELEKADQDGARTDGAKL